MKITAIQTSNFLGARAVDVKLTKPVTLFCHGAYTKPWGFLKPVEISHADSVLMWVPFTDARKESGLARWWQRAPKGKNEPRRVRG